MSIKPLPPDVIAQIKSSTTILNLNGVADELVKNSLDAAATRIELTVDYGRGGCSVEDDGLGIDPFEFSEKGGLGKLYHTSKLSSQTLQHGGRGTFLASLSAMSLLTITSRHHLHRSHNTLSAHKSEVVTRQTPASLQYHLTSFKHGTRVTVRDLFGNMPVRVKQRAIEFDKSRSKTKDWEDLKREIVLLLLSWHKNVAVTLREADTGQKLVIKPNHVADLSEKVGITRVCSVLSQATLISPDQKASWVSVSASTPNLKIRGAISLDPGPTKNVQFLSLGIQPLSAINGQNILHDDINRLFMNSAFGNEEEALDLSESERARRAKDARYKSYGYTNRELKGGKKGVDRWPMFYIDIQPKHATRNLNMDDPFDEGKNDLSSITLLLQVMITEFLAKNHFRSKHTRGHQTQQVIETEASSSYNGSLSIRPAATPSTTSASSKKRKRSSAIRKSILKPSLRRSDPLGTNIKLPSFRHSALIPGRPDSPFDAWSRVKSGSTRPKSITIDNGTSIERPASAPPPSQAPTTSVPPRCPTADIPKRSGVPLFSRTGKILRGPFDDVVTRRTLKPIIPTVLNTPPRHLQDSEVATGDTDTDEHIIWINPITKVESRINKRTGLTLPTSKSNLTTRRRSKFSSSTNPSSSSTSLQNHQYNTAKEPSPWILNILKTWDNPIFPPTEPSIRQVSFTHADLNTQHILHGRKHHCSQIDIDRAFTDSASGIKGRISKTELRDAEIINQVDNKFILVKVKPTEQERFGEEILVLIDQHAADERIRIESLMEELCRPPEANGLESGILTMAVDKQLVFELEEREIRLLNAHKHHFANWGVLYSVDSAQPSKAKAAACHVTVTHLPPPILERCKLNPNLLIDLIRTELYKINDNRTPVPSHTSNPKPANNEETDQPAWLTRISSCPQGIIDMLNSRACRSAIMFNDVLSREQCEILVRRLGECAFPWMCAHGRVSLVPVLGMEGFGMGTGIELGDIRDSWRRDGGFGLAFGRWKRELSGNEEGG